MLNPNTIAHIHHMIYSIIHGMQNQPIKHINKGSGYMYGNCKYQIPMRMYRIDGHVMNQEFIITDS